MDGFLDAFSPMAMAKIAPRIDEALANSRADCPETRYFDELLRTCERLRRPLHCGPEGCVARFPRFRRPPFFEGPRVRARPPPPPPSLTPHYQTPLQTAHRARRRQRGPPVGRGRAGAPAARRIFR